VITVARRVGDRVRVAPYAHGETTGSDVQDRLATVVDCPPQGGDQQRERYFLRFVRDGAYGEHDCWFDWVAGEHLKDY
jgi:hypothetical protein